ncbi:ImmA/IrrE family metallo-endopeptidase [Litoricola sp.]|nr:ImmA/IrrE family metallo-endopeptidase [Litorivicinus sp.]
MLPDAAVEDIFSDLIEEAADQLLDQYRDFAGAFDLPVPVESIAEHFLKYDLEITDEGLFADPRFLGGISFETNTIFVNASIEDHEGRYTFTIAHEIGHHVLHKELYDELISDRSQILCREEKKKPLIEQQADRFAASLMMPRRMLVDEVEKFGKSRPRTLGDALRLANHLNTACGFQNVSISALVNRLKDLDLVHQSIPYQTGTRWRSATSWNPISYIMRRLKRWLP